MGNSKSTNQQMQETVFELKLQSKTMQRSAQKAEKDSKKERMKVKKVPRPPRRFRADSVVIDDP